jgi:hypothetical protein
LIASIPLATRLNPLDNRRPDALDLTINIEILQHGVIILYRLHKSCPTDVGKAVPIEKMPEAEMLRCLVIRRRSINKTGNVFVE